MIVDEDMARADAYPLLHPRRQGARSRPPSSMSLLARDPAWVRHREEGVDLVAEHLAASHADSLCDEGRASVAAPELLEQRIAEAAARLPSATGNAEALGEATRWLRAFLRGHRQLFAQRAAARRMCQLHGRRWLPRDWPEVPGASAPAADAVVGSAPIGDVASDVADLANDLALAGRADLAERFVVRYVDHSDDYALLAVLPFYRALRAVERCLGERDDDPRAWLVSAALAEQAREVACAIASVPALVVVAGRVSELRHAAAEAAATVLAAPSLRLDPWLPGDRGQRAVPGERAAPHTDAYSVALERAALVLASGRGCVLEGGFHSNEMRITARELAEHANAAFRFVDCRDEMPERSPPAQWPDIGLAGRHLDEVPDHERIVVPADTPIGSALADLRAALRPWNRTGVES